MDAQADLKVHCPHILKTSFPIHWNLFIRWFIISRWFKIGPEKCCNLTKMYRLYSKMTVYGHFFLYNLYIWVLLQHGCLVSTVFALDPTVG